MSTEQFWQIIAASSAGSAGGKDAQAGELATQLAKQKPAEVAAFEHLFEEHIDRAYHWDLWGAAYVIRGGCSDDSFIDFRSWLISQGQAVYENALADAESLAELDLGDDPSEETCFEAFAYVAAQVYQEQTGEQMPYSDRKAPAEPTGEEWEEDEAGLAQRFPRLWEKYGWKA